MDSIVFSSEDGDITITSDLTTDKVETDFLTSKKVKVKDDTLIDGSENKITGQTDFTGRTRVKSGGLEVKSGSNWTTFSSTNSLRGKTTVHNGIEVSGGGAEVTGGNLKVHANGEFCIGDVCVNENDLSQMKQNFADARDNQCCVSVSPNYRKKRHVCFSPGDHDMRGYENMNDKSSSVWCGSRVKMRMHMDVFSGAYCDVNKSEYFKLNDSAGKARCNQHNFDNEVTTVSVRYLDQSFDLLQSNVPT